MRILHPLSSSHQSPSILPLFTILLFISFLHSQTLQLVPYLTLPSNPYLFDIHPKIVLVAYENTPNTTIIREYCQESLEHEYSIPFLLQSMKTQGGAAVCGDGNLLLIELNNRNLHFYLKQTQSFVNVVEENVVGAQFMQDQNKVIYIGDSNQVYDYDFPTNTTTQNNRDSLMPGQNFSYKDLLEDQLQYHLVKYIVVQGKKQIKSTQKLSGVSKKIGIANSSKLVIGVGPSSYECCDNIVTKPNQITHSYNTTIDIYIDKNLTHQIIRPDIIYYSILVNQLLYIVEKNSSTQLTIMNITNQMILDVIDLSGLGNQFYKVLYFQEENLVLLYNQLNCTIYTIQNALNGTVDSISDDIQPSASTVPNSEPTLVTPSEQTSVISQEDQFVALMSDLLFSEESQRIMNGTVTASSVSFSAQIATGLLRPIFNLIEDFWFYHYHQKVYPEFVEKLTYEFDILSMMRIKPQFLEEPFVFQKALFEQQNQLYYKVSNIKGRAPTNQYFFTATKDVYIMNFSFVAVLFLSLFFFKAICFIIKCAAPDLERAYILLSKQIKFRNMLIAIFLPNLAVMIFSSSFQIRFLYCFQFQNKINMLITIIILFFWISFASVSYLMIYRYEKEDSQDIIEVSKFGFRGIMIESFLNNKRRLLYAVIHGLLLDHQMAQLGLLCLVDFFVILVCFKMRKTFKSMSFQILITIYYATFFIFDCTLLLYCSEVFPQLNYNIITTIEIMVLILFSLFKMLLLIAYWIKETVQFLREQLCDTNRVCDDSSQLTLKKNDDQRKSQNEDAQLNRDKTSTIVKEIKKRKHMMNENKKSEIEKIKKKGEDKVGMEISDLQNKSSNSSKNSGYIVNVFETENRIHMMICKSKKKIPDQKNKNFQTQ